LQQLPVDARLVVVAGDERLGRGGPQVGQALVVGGQQEQVAVGVLRAPVGGEVGLHAEDRLDPGLVAGPLVLGMAGAVAVVGDGQGRVARRSRALCRLHARGQPVKLAVLRVVVEVHVGQGWAPGRRRLVCLLPSRTGAVVPLAPGTPRGLAGGVPGYLRDQPAATGVETGAETGPSPSAAFSAGLPPSSLARIPAISSGSGSETAAVSAAAAPACPLPSATSDPAPSASGSLSSSACGMRNLAKNSGDACSRSIASRSMPISSTAAS